MDTGAVATGIGMAFYKFFTFINYLYLYIPLRI